MFEMNHVWIIVVAKHRTNLAAFRPVGSEHEVINDQLATIGKQIAQRFFAVGPVERVFLVDFLPRQVTPQLS